MPRTLDPFRLLLFAVAGWMNHEQQQVLDYLREENRILHAQLGTRRLRFDDEQRRRLAVRAKLLGRRVLAEVATIVTPDTLLRWHRKLIAEKYDGRPRTANKGDRFSGSHRAHGDREPGLGLPADTRRVVQSGTHGCPRHGRQYPEETRHRAVPQRNRQTNWKEFLSRHWELLVAADFFTVELWTRRGLQRFVVLFFID